ncbi:MAG: PEPxxWA-CTERM sorting domain-containing protein [Burkholderiales bacterium]|nr:PEPxxWA-CTERM sorting domain-containing protein [Burkholderiales bacterium]
MNQLKKVGLAVGLAIVSMGAQAAENLINTAPWFPGHGVETFSGGSTTLGSGQYGWFNLALTAGEQYVVSFTSSGAGMGTVDLYALDIALSGNFNRTPFGQGLHTYQFTTGASQTFTHLELAWLSGSDINVSGISVTAVPEPESWAMLLVGLTAVGGLARRRKAGQITG